MTSDPLIYNSISTNQPSKCFYDLVCLWILTMVNSWSTPPLAWGRCSRTGWRPRSRYPLWSCPWSRTKTSGSDPEIKKDHVKTLLWPILHCATFFRFLCFRIFYSTYSLRPKFSIWTGGLPPIPSAFQFQTLSKFPTAWLSQYQIDK